MSAKCGICSHTVYAVDPQINLNGSIYHKICAKCVDCRCQITVANFTKSGDTLLCKTHYMKRFNEQGTFLGAEKFKQQPVRGLAALNPAAETASSSPSISSQKSFSEDTERSNSVKERMKKFAAASSTPKCAICERSVYANDPQVVLDGLSYHRGCAKCTDCKCQITIQNFNKSGSTLYCTTHYLKKFHEDGTILGAEKFTHQSAPGKFAGSGFTIPVGNDANSPPPPPDSEVSSPPPPSSSSSSSTTTTHTTHAAPAPAPPVETVHEPAPVVSTPAPVVASEPVQEPIHEPPVEHSSEPVHEEVVVNHEAPIESNDPAPVESSEVVQQEEHQHEQVQEQQQEQEQHQEEQQEQKQEQQENNEEVEEDTSV